MIKDKYLACKGSRVQNIYIVLLILEITQEISSMFYQVVVINNSSVIKKTNHAGTCSTRYILL